MLFKNSADAWDRLATAPADDGKVLTAVNLGGGIAAPMWQDLPAPQPSDTPVLFSGRMTLVDALPTSAFYANGGPTGSGHPTALRFRLAVPNASRTLRHLRVRVLSNTLSVAATVRVYLNGSTTSLAVTVAAGVTGDATDDATSIALADGDDLDIAVEVAAGGSMAEAFTFTACVNVAPA
jgi:hypothetical protein